MRQNKHEINENEMEDQPYFTITIRILYPFLFYHHNLYSSNIRRKTQAVLFCLGWWDPRLSVLCWESGLTIEIGPVKILRGCKYLAKISEQQQEQQV